MKEPAVFMFKVAIILNLAKSVSVSAGQSIEVSRHIGDLWPRISLMFGILVFYSLESPLWGTNKPTNQKRTVGGNFVVAQVCLSIHCAVAAYEMGKAQSQVASDTFEVEQLW
jgi:hypothetical protein